MLGALPRRHGRCGARGGIYLHWILGHVEMHFVPTTGNAFIGIEPELVALKPSLLLAIPLRLLYGSRTPTPFLRGPVHSLITGHILTVHGTTIYGPH